MADERSSASSEWDERLPPRLFETDRFPSKRLNVYSKVEMLLVVRDLLKGSHEWEVIRSSCFGKLFELPTARCPVSCKLLHSLLTRQLVTRKKYMLWTVFGGHPLRFALADFAAVTGLPCGDFPDNYDHEYQPLNKDISDEYWTRLIGLPRQASLSDIVHMMRETHDLSSWRRIRLALLLIVDGVLVASSQHTKPTPKYVKMVEDVLQFLKFPWGRESFMWTISSMKPCDSKPGRRDDNVRLYCQQLKQETFRLVGFPLALQLVAFEGVPMLAAKMSVRTRATMLVDYPGNKLPPKSLTLADVLEVEAAESLIVQPFIGDNVRDDEWDDEIRDRKVTYLEDLVQKGHKFSKREWPGGDASSPLTLYEKDVAVHEGFGEKRKRDADSSRNVRKKKKVAVDAAPTVGVTEETVALLVDRVEKLCERVEKLERRLGKRDLRRRVRNAGGYRAPSCSGGMEQGHGRTNSSQGRPNTCDSREFADGNAEETISLKDHDGVPLAWLTKENIGRCTKKDAVAAQRHVAKESEMDRCGGVEDFDVSKMFGGKNAEDGGVGPAEEDGVEQNSCCELRGPKVDKSMSHEHTLEGSKDDCSLEGGSDSRGEKAADQEQESENCERTDMCTSTPAFPMTQDRAGEVDIIDGRVDDHIDVMIREFMLDPVDVTAAVAKEIMDVHGDTSDAAVGVEVGEKTSSKEDSVNANVLRSDGGGGLEEDEENGEDVCESGEQGEGDDEEEVDDDTVYLSDSPVEEDVPHVPSEEELSLSQALQLKTVYDDCVLISETENPRFDVFNQTLMAHGGVKHRCRMGFEFDNNFLLVLAGSRLWINTLHMEMLMCFLGEKHRDLLRQQRLSFASPWLTTHIEGKYRAFSKAIKKEMVGFDEKMKNFVRIPGQTWVEDVDTIYAPMIWSASHWVGLSINLVLWSIKVLDPNPYMTEVMVGQYMKPIVEMLPYIIRKMCPPQLSQSHGTKPFTWSRVSGLYQNVRKGDCGPVAAKFMELHAFGNPEPGMEGMTDKMVDNFRQQYAMDIYREWVVPLYS